ncbi:hypothetical protein JTE90_002823 [Oedothorax gibbosus]|uniref:Poly(A) RNA polymerase mitochondrial-like central palm domain-containing protein n=1 Tax=Oedothorax gibbosus TaxID=931172 RepID=A0AAV6U880_9ARAC|nr:hypothetical protein JTE90_002823 [Oedothorax gibbosus]
MAGVRLHARFSSFEDLDSFRKISTFKVMNKEVFEGIKSTSTFQQQLHLRKKEAERSILIELYNKSHVPHAASTCEQFGEVKNLYTYRGESENVFLLLEFEQEDSLKRLLSQCHYENISDSFTVHSRTVRFENLLHKSAPKLNIKANEEGANRVLSKVKTVSELIEDLYKTEKISELDTRRRYFFCSLVKDSLSGIFPYCDVLPFGSSVNGIGRKGCDLDIMIRLYPLQNNEDSEFCFVSKICIGNVQELQKRSLNILGDFFRTFLPGFSSVKKILHARVPIVKVTHRLLEIECDISVNNMSAILMSEMLYFCGEIDLRVRPLLYAVKKWAKEACVTYDSPGSWITNFGLSLLVVFFLQNRPVPILPSLNDAVNINGAECMPNFHLEYLTPLSELQANASLNTETLAELLNEFLSFIGSCPFNNKHYSILSGKATDKNSGSPMWVQYPLEEDKNVTKNISQKEMMDMCDKALLSSSCLAGNMQLQRTSSDLSSIIGIQNIKNSFSPKNTNLKSVISKEMQKNISRMNRRAS